MSAQQAVDGYKLAQGLIQIANTSDFGDLREEMLERRVMLELWGSEGRMSTAERLALATATIHALNTALTMILDEAKK